MRDPNIEVLRTQYESLSKKLRAKGFNEDMQSDVTCRFRGGELILDVMPNESKILGFANRWYEPGIENSTFLSLDEKMKAGKKLPFERL